MTPPKFDQRFFASTRGRIVLLLRESRRTVNDIAAELDLTDNAVRAHLLSLERDGLVTQSGMVKGFRKPHFLYKLTDNARHLFPTAYDSLINYLLDELKGKLGLDAVKSLLVGVGRRVGKIKRSGSDVSLDEKVASAVETLRKLGGSAQVSRENGILSIHSESCPFAEAVVEHPEVCRIAEAMVGEIVGKPVREKCDRDGQPKCCFQIDEAGSHA